VVPCSCYSNAIKKVIKTLRPAQTYFLLGATVGGTVGYGLYLVLLHRWKLGDGEPLEKQTAAPLKNGRSDRLVKTPRITMGGRAVVFGVHGCSGPAGHDDMWWACVGGGAVLMGLVAVKKDKALTIVGTSMLGSMMVQNV
jgi:hypothetical protein